MDKTIVLAVAGSGKTSFIIDNLNLEKRFLLITYTINNTRNLKRGIIKKFGYFPENIDLFSYYTFLYSFCFKPFLAYKIKPRGIFWEVPPQWTNRIRRNDIRFYITSNRKLYHNRIAKLLELYGVLDDIKERMEKYFDCFFIDETQDFAGHDFNLLREIVKANLEIILVGDFYQHTFDTSRDGNTNKNLHTDYKKYIKHFEDIGVKPNREYLNKSWRCSPTVCNYITENLGIDIHSHSEVETTVKFISNEDEADMIFKDNNIVKLFYRENYKYECFSRNWGDCKGENCYKDVCVVLNKTSMKYYNQNNLTALKPVTKNKLYVAISRASRNIFLISEELLKKYKKNLTKNRLIFNK